MRRPVPGKARVHELAKEFGVDSKTVLAKLKEQGEFVKSASSTVEAPVARRLREALGASGAGNGAAAPAPKPAARPGPPVAAAPAAPAPPARRRGGGGRRRPAPPAPPRPPRRGPPPPPPPPPRGPPPGRRPPVRWSPVPVLARPRLPRRLRRRARPCSSPRLRAPRRP